MDLALIEGLMDTIGIQQSRMNIKNETDYVSIPANISEIFNIDKEGYYMHIINNTKNEDINQCVWSFYQCILYFLNKNYHLMSEQSKEQNYESFLIKFKQEIERMFYIIHDKMELNVQDINDPNLLNILSKYIDYKIVILNPSDKSIKIYPDTLNKSKKIVLLKVNENIFYPIFDKRFQGYEFINEYSYCIASTDQKTCKTTSFLSEKNLNSMSKNELLEIALKYNIDTTKQGKTKTITKTKNEIIADILKHVCKK